MRDAPRIANVTFTPARPLDVALGLLGFVSCNVDSLRVDGIALRRTAAGRLDLRFPSMGRGARGRKYQIVWPADDAARRSIEAQVIGALQRKGLVA